MKKYTNSLSCIKIYTNVHPRMQCILFFIMYCGNEKGKIGIKRCSMFTKWGGILAVLNIFAT